jgi:hypothetical protein
MTLSMPREFHGRAPGSTETIVSHGRLNVFLELLDRALAKTPGRTAAEVVVEFGNAIQSGAIVAGTFTFGVVEVLGRRVSPGGVIDGHGFNEALSDVFDFLRDLGVVSIMNLV